MNYRHIFHAGNFADVAKHVGLVCLLERLAAKGKPFAYVDTHAGAGLYDLGRSEASRSGEANEGIRRLASGPAAEGVIGRYLKLVRSFQPQADTLDIYPGSPLIAQRMMRDTDRAILCELQPEQARQLRQKIGADRRFAIHQRDGYEGLGALLPPQPRRGMVLIDPPYEQEHELQRLIPVLEQATRRWPTGIFVVWYPIKHRRELRGFYRQLAGAGLGPVLLAELGVRPGDNEARLNGSGLAIIRPPWRIEQTLTTVWTELARRLGDAAGAWSDVSRLSRSAPAVEVETRKARHLARSAAAAVRTRR
ncbi:MAG: 23S rRNA (adenine(2030)-N(6))-methyltransferase RlmJ [Gammaproteobacteria bacterium]